MGNNIKTKMIDGKTCVPTSFLAEIFGVSTKTLAAWAKDGCPKAERGWWPVKEVIAWRIQGSRESADLEKMSLKERKLYWEGNLKKAQTENREFENGVKRGDYIEKQAVADELAALFVAFKQAVLLLPRKIGILASASVEMDLAKEIEHEVSEVIYDALAEWSQGKLSGLDAGEFENAEAAGKDDGEPMGR